jgi:hypothetical protein
MKLSDPSYSVVSPLLATDQVVMLRESGGNFVNVRAVVQTFVNDLLTLIGEDTVTWANVDKTVSDLADLTTKKHSDLTEKGTNSHTQIDSFIAAYSPAKIITFSTVESDLDVTIIDGTVAFTVPALLNGYNLTGVLASVHTLGSGSGATAIQIRRRRAGVEADMLSTKVTVSYNEYFASDGVINTSYDDLATGDRLYVDVDQLPSTPPKGLGIALTFNV